MQAAVDTMGQAVEQMEHLGYTLIGRDVETAHGTIDAVMSKGDVATFLTEVEAVADSRLAVNQPERARLRRAALEWMSDLRTSRHGHLRDMRFDIAMPARDGAQLVWDAF